MFNENIVFEVTCAYIMWRYDSTKFGIDIQERNDYLGTRKSFYGAPFRHFEAFTSYTFASLWFCGPYLRHYVS